MLKILSIFTLLALGAACGGETTTETTSSSVGTSNSSLSLSNRWASSSFPLTIRLSDAFTSGKRAAVVSTSTAWETAVSNEINFFSIGADTSEKSYTDLNDYGSDNEMGVYELDVWPSELPTSALAVTQLFGQRVNSGGGSYVEFFHADILVNKEFYSFTENSTPNDGLYDFNLVMVHELGHFIGLSHTSDSSANSVMQPSIGTADDYEGVYAYDQNSIRSAYSLTSSESVVGAAMISALSTDNQQEELEYTGEYVKVTIELHADGKCRHLENGKIVAEHDHDHHHSH